MKGREKGRRKYREDGRKAATEGDRESRELKKGHGRKVKGIEK